MKELNTDIRHILQNRDSTVLQQLKSNYRNFIPTSAAKIRDVTAYINEYAMIKRENVNKPLELQQKVEKLNSEIDAIKLQQKIVDKKISNTVKQQNVLTNECDAAKSKRECLCMEIVDLQQETETKGQQKKAQWTALKRACLIYKENLDFHINLRDDEQRERIKISFFIKDDATKDKYCVYLCNRDGQWKVDETDPALKEEHLNHFEDIVDFSKQSEVSNVTAYLCRLRQIFLKYYMNTK